MLKYFRRQLAALALVLLLVISAVPFTAAAESVEFIDLTFGDFEVSFANGEGTMEQLSENSVQLTATGDSGCMGDEAGTNMVVINIPEGTVISFDYEIENGGSFEVATDSGEDIYPVGNHYLYTAKQTFLYATSKAEAGSTVTVTLTNINCVEAQKFDIIVQGAENGTVTVGEDTFSSAEDKKTYESVVAADGLALSATPASGYAFVGFKVNDSETLVSANANFTYKPAEDLTTITPVFTKTATLIAGDENVGWSVCTTLKAAISAVNSNGGTLIVPVNNFTVAKATYTIPAGVTFLVPNSMDYTPMNKPNYTSASTPSVYRTVTLNTGTVLNVNGNLTLNANWVRPGGGSKVQLSGKFSRICLKGSATINMKDGSNLNAWGFIYDYNTSVTGKVNAESGSTVREVFQWTDWRGGTISSLIYQNILPLSQYYIQNIESKLVINHGAQERAYFSVSGGGQTPELDIGVVGAEGSESLFWLNTEGSSMTKWYDKAADRVMIRFDGPYKTGSPNQNSPDFELNQIKFSVMGYSFDSTPYFLPVNNMNITIDNGTLNIRYKTEFLPDSGVEIGSNAILNIAKDGVLYLIDKNVWACDYYSHIDSKTYYIRPVVYTSNGKAPAFTRKCTPTVNNTTTAYCKVNGIVNVQGVFAVNTGNNANNTPAKGGMDPARAADFSSITTSPNVYSETDGAIVRFDYISEVPKIYGCKAKDAKPQYVYYDEFVSESVWLNNADGTPVKTADQGTMIYTYNATAGEWNTTKIYTVKWMDGNEEELSFSTHLPGETPVYNGETPEIEDDLAYTYGDFLGWSKTPYGDIVVQPGGTFPAVGNEDVTYYAVFDRTEKKYTAVWLMDDDSEIANSGETEYNYTDVSALECPGGNPAKGATRSGTFYEDTKGAEFTEYNDNALEYTYSFNDWDTNYTFDNETGKGVCTRKAMFSSTQNNLVLFLNYDQTEVLYSTYINDNEYIYPTKAYVGESPTKPSDAQYDYTFEGWRNIYSSTVYSTDTSSTWTYNPTSSSRNANRDVYYPVFDSTVRSYDVTWLDDDGTQLGIDSVQYGQLPTHNDMGENHDNTYIYTFKGWTPEIESVTGPATYQAEYDTTEIFNKHSLTLDGCIGVNFYVLTPEGYNAGNTTIDCSWGKKFITTQQYDDNTPKTKTGIKGKADGDYVKFTLPIAVKELNDDISVTLKSGDTVIATETYRPTAYLYELYQKSDEELAPYLTGSQTADQLRELVRTMLINAANAQTYFNYNTTLLATYRFDELGISYDLDDLTVPDAKKLYPDDSELSDVTFYGAALNLEDETGYTLYFNITNPSSYSIDKYGDVSATINGGAKKLKIDDELGVMRLSGGKRLRVKMDGLAAAEITNDIAFTYKGTVFTVNAGYYIALAMNSGSEPLKNVAKSVYNYNQAAVAFFGGSN